MAMCDSMNSWMRSRRAVAIAVSCERAFGFLLRGEQLSGGGAQNHDRQNRDEHEGVKRVAAQAARL